MPHSETAPLAQCQQLYKLLSGLHWPETRNGTFQANSLSLALLKETIEGRTQAGDTENLRAFWNTFPSWLAQFGWKEEKNGFGVVVAVSRRLSAYSDPDGTVSIFLTGQLDPWLIFDEMGVVIHQHFPSAIGQDEAFLLPDVIAKMTGTSREAAATLLPKVDLSIIDD